MEKAGYLAREREGTAVKALLFNTVSGTGHGFNFCQGKVQCNRQQL
jgi:hypothetical protein